MNTPKKTAKSDKAKQTHKSLIEMVKECLGHNGFPLEMEVADSLFSMGFDVTHSDRYVDSDTQKDREIDVVAEKTWHHPGIKFNFKLKLIIECKKSEKPFVLFVGNKKRGWASLSGAFASPVYLKAENTDTRARFDRACKNSAEPLAGAVMGYNLWRAEPRPGGSDVANEACYSVVKATEYGMSKQEVVFLKIDETITATVPIICIDSNLAKCEFQDEIKVERIDFGVLRWSQRNIENQPSKILVAVKSAFPAILGSIYKKYDDINNSIKANNAAWNQPIEDPLDGILRAYGLLIPPPTV